MFQIRLSVTIKIETHVYMVDNGNNGIRLKAVGQKGMWAERRNTCLALLLLLYL